MKLGKKLWSILLTMVMVFAMMVPAMADSTTSTTTDPTKVTIVGTGNKFSAWQLLTATEGNNNNFAYELNSKYADVFQAVTNKTTSKDIVAYITGLTNADDVRGFADAMYAAIKTAGLAADATTTSNTFKLDQGYYLIAETEKGANPDTVSKVMLDTKGKTQLTVETKEGTVELEKKVEEKNDTTGATNLQDHADYDFGDAVPFQLKGTLPANYNGYDTYYYCFVDNLSSGLSLNRDSVKVYVADADVTDIMAEGVTKTDITSAFTLTTTSTGFELVCNNLKTSVGSLDKDNPVAIFVRYTATLTSGATIGATGNPNEAKVVFSNDPYSDSHGETVKDVVIVFTYEYDVNKVDGAGEALTGAGFTLYKEVGGKWVMVGSEIKGENITTFEFKGLDAGKYKLEETTVPKGYNQAAPIEFTITASYENQKLTINGIENTTGKIVTDVENLTGTELPSTGGIGTTIFYVAGGILVVGAAVMLIAKKRTENEE